MLQLPLNKALPLLVAIGTLGWSGTVMADSGYSASGVSASPATTGATAGAASGLPGASQDSQFLAQNVKIKVDWSVTKFQELGCGGPAIAGGQISGNAEFNHLGKSTLQFSAAWDIGHLLSQHRYHPVGPAGGPVAPVLGTGSYPHPFHFNPLTGQCGDGVSASGHLVITAANGDQVFGDVTGGETFRLDFHAPGDGIESFLEIQITGGTGR